MGPLSKPFEAFIASFACEDYVAEVRRLALCILCDTSSGGREGKEWAHKLHKSSRPLLAEAVVELGKLGMAATAHAAYIASLLSDRTLRCTDHVEAAKVLGSMEASRALFAPQLNLDPVVAAAATATLQKLAPYLR